MIIASSRLADLRLGVSIQPPIQPADPDPETRHAPISIISKICGWRRRGTALGVKNKKLT